MKNIVFYLCFFLLLHYNVSAQGEGNVWAFGPYAGLNFNSGHPVATQTAINGIEGTASICDAQGKLLFYTDGSFIWNRIGQIMPNANNLTGMTAGTFTSVTGSTTEAAVIVPMPNNANQYYVFSLTSLFSFQVGGVLPANGSSSQGMLFYSVVDMTLNGGLGDIVPGKKGIFIDSNFSEKMTAVAGDRNNVCDRPSNTWLVLHSNTTNSFSSYEISNKGLDTQAVISFAGTFYPPIGQYGPGFGPYSEGNMKFSPDGRKLATVNCSHWYGLELYDFDAATGIVSNPVLLDSLQGYGICFSPDGSKLYMQCFYLEYDVLQYDLSLATSAAIKASRTPIIDSELFLGDLKLGPDGKIYFLNSDYGYSLGLTGIGDPNFINVINYPNLAGTACQAVMNAVPLLPGTNSYNNVGWPNATIVVRPKDTVYRTIDTAICIPKLTLQADTTKGKYSYLWNTGDTASSLHINDFGTYTVTYYNQCTRYVDTFHVSLHSFPYVVAPGSSNCLDQYSAWVQVPSNNADILSFTWVDAAGNIIRQSQSSGADTIRGLDTGTYSVQVQTPLGCDTVLNFSFQPSTSAITGAFGGCVSDGRPGLVWVTPVDSGTYTYRWRNYEGAALPEYNTTSNNGDTIAATQQGVYTVEVTGANNCMADFNITVPGIDPGPVLTNVTPSQIIKPGSSLQLNAIGALHYLWVPDSGTLNNDNISNPIATPTDSITYVVIGTDTMGCTSRAAVHIDIDFLPLIPNAFSPNGDSKNDVFRILDLKYNRLLEFKVFSRWGKLLFSTKDAEQGWDGTYNGVPQDMDIYNYIISVAQQGGKEISYKGEVTLIR